MRKRHIKRSAVAQQAPLCLRRFVSSSKRVLKPHLRHTQPFQWLTKQQLRYLQDKQQTQGKTRSKGENSLMLAGRGLYKTASSSVSKEHKWLQGSQCVPTQCDNVANLEALLCLSKISTMKQSRLWNCRLGWLSAQISSYTVIHSVTQVWALIIPCQIRWHMKDIWRFRIGNQKLCHFIWSL